MYRSVCTTRACWRAQIKTYTAFAIAGTLREELWIDDKGYLRNVPLTADNKAVDWNSAPAWNHCCTNNTPLSQDGYIVSARNETGHQPSWCLSTPLGLVLPAYCTF